MIKEQCKSALGIISLTMQVGKNVALYLTFPKLIVDTGPTFRCFTFVMPAASQNNKPQITPKQPKAQLWLNFKHKNRGVRRIMSVLIA